ncbi:MAG: hypothetical protein Alpg2KO_21480 [Alphaproteobacteria bacterium]
MDKDYMDGSRPPKQLDEVTEDANAEALRQSMPLEQRRELAKCQKTAPETLALLASDKDVEVRKHVAGNDAAPAQVSPILARDEVIEVRLILTERLTRMLPGISDKEQKKLFDLTMMALTELATDQAVKVRIALSHALKDYDRAPDMIVRELAEDIVQEVASPILKMADSLTDKELLRIIATHSEAWRMQSIAKRKGVSAEVSDAIVKKQVPDATRDLIQNDSAKIADKTLKFAAERLTDDPQLKDMIIARRSLPKRLAGELNELAGSVARRILGKRRDLVDRRAATVVALAVDRRMKLANTASEKDCPLDRARKMHKGHMLDEHTVLDALSVGDEDFCRAALSVLAVVELQTVTRILETKSPKPVIALCWQARISARCAFDIQARLAHVPAKQLLSPRGGTKYPLTMEDIEMQLGLFDITPRAGSV